MGEKLKNSAGSESKSVSSGLIGVGPTRQCGVVGLEAKLGWVQTPVSSGKLLNSLGATYKVELIIIPTPQHREWREVQVRSHI